MGALYASPPCLGFFALYSKYHYATHTWKFLTLQNFLLRMHQWKKKLFYPLSEQFEIYEILYVSSRWYVSLQAVSTPLMNSSESTSPFCNSHREFNWDRGATGRYHIVAPCRHLGPLDSMLCRIIPLGSIPTGNIPDGNWAPRKYKTVKIFPVCYLLVLNLLVWSNTTS